jgi:hypothetical protein
VGEQRSEGEGEVFFSPIEDIWIVNDMKIWPGSIKTIGLTYVIIEESRVSFNAVVFPRFASLDF